MQFTLPLIIGLAGLAFLLTVGITEATKPLNWETNLYLIAIGILLLLVAGFLSARIHTPLFSMGG